MKAYKSLIEYALSQNYTVSVWDGEQWQVNRSTKFGTIVEAVESTKLLYIRNKNFPVSSVLVSSHLDDDETVIDYSDCAFMRDWFNFYDTN